MNLTVKTPIFHNNQQIRIAIKRLTTVHLSLKYFEYSIAVFLKLKFKHRLNFGTLVTCAKIYLSREINLKLIRNNNRGGGYHSESN